MKKRLCIFKTHNHAVAAFSLLKRAGVHCEIVPTPQKYMKEKTCSYSVAFQAEAISTARDILSKNNLDFYIV